MQVPDILHEYEERSEHNIAGVMLNTCYSLCIGLQVYRQLRAAKVVCVDGEVVRLRTILILKFYVNAT